MNYLIVIGNILLIAVLITYCIVSLRKGGKSGRILSVAFFSSALLYTFFLFGALTKFFMPKVTFYSMAVAVGNWAFFCIYIFLKKICDVKLNKFITPVLAVLLGFDSVMYLINPFWGHAVRYTSFKMYGLSLLVASDGAFYTFHGLLRLALTILYQVIFIIKIRQVSKYYKTPYYSAMGIVFVILFIEFGAPHISTGITDVSNIITVLAEVVLFHLTYNFSPTKLLVKLQGYIEDSINEATIAYDDQGRLMTANKIARDIIPSKSLLDLDTLLENLGNPEEGKDFRFEANDRIYRVEYRKIYDEKDINVASVVIFDDITDLEKRIDKELKISRTDSLTGAYNRRGFIAASEDFLETHGKDTEYALIVSGILGFKSINSSYGTRAGDEVLKKIESMFRDYHHNYPLLYGRTAEGKFSVLLPADYVDEIASDMSCINVDIGDDIQIHVDMCHGYIVLEDKEKPITYYYERALLALTECKRKINVSILEYSYAMEEKIMRKQKLLSHMHEGIRNGDFYIELQPQINLDTRRVEGAEALVRWVHPELGRVSPGEFIPVFEENGFIGNLDVFTWELAAKTLKQLSDEDGYDGSVSINISRMDIMSMDVVSVLERIVRETEIDKKRFHLEITESASADNRVKLVETMNLLRQAGFYLEIDDFGSGYSSLNALMKLPFDVIKLDMEFMRETNLQGKNGIIMNSLADMIHRLGAKIIVEGVETETNVENMVFFGGDVAQGYYFSKPLPIDKFRQYLAEHNVTKGTSTM